MLDARVRIEGPAGRREIPIDELFVGSRQTCLGPDDVLAAILLDPPPPRARSVFLKKTRVHMDLALSSVAVLLEMDAVASVRQAAAELKALGESA